VAANKYRNILTDAHSCEDRKFLFDINSVDAVEMAVAQHSGIKEAMSIPDLKIYGLSLSSPSLPLTDPPSLPGTSYEFNIQTDLLGTYSALLAFIWSPARPRSSASPSPPSSAHLKDELSVYHPHLRCDLSDELSNYKELECALASSPLHWVINDRQQASLLSFEQILESGDRFLEYVKQADPVILKTCQTRARARLDPRVFKELARFKMQKRANRCGHGGHTQVDHSSCFSVTSLSDSCSRHAEDWDK
jgi:hypothetical protein